MFFSIVSIIRSECDGIQRYGKPHPSRSSRTLEKRGELPNTTRPSELTLSRPCLRQAINSGDGYRNLVTSNKPKLFSRRTLHFERVVHNAFQEEHARGTNDI
jgi:hypothetical protein